MEGVTGECEKREKRGVDKVGAGHHHRGRNQCQCGGPTRNPSNSAVSNEGLPHVAKSEDCGEQVILEEEKMHTL